MRYPLYGLCLLLVSLMLMNSCATPVAPQGGPPDRTPPELRTSEPANGTVNFDGREFRFNFSKFLNRDSFRNAIEVEPDLGIGYEVRFRRRTAIIEFERDLPENTTVILRVGTALADMQNNRIGSPIQLAVSTGPEIDEGEVKGRVRRATDGGTEDGYRVFLFREPFDLSSRAAYVAETDTAGYVSFSYLAADRYKALWVEDRNRNRRWEPERERAQPFGVETFTLESGGTYNLGTLFISRPDTTRPRLEGVGLLTSNRLRLRFDEEIYWQEGASIEIRDTLGEGYSTAWPIYVDPGDFRVVLAQAEEDLAESEMFELRLDGFSDAAGNPARVATGPFSGSAEPDTVRLAIIGDNRDPGLFPDEPLVVAYNKWIDRQQVVDSLRVVAGDEMIEAWPHIDIDRHRLRIYPDPVWESGITYQFLAWNPAMEQLRPIEPVIWQRNQLGSLELRLREDSDTTRYRFRVFDEERKVDRDSVFTGQVEIDGLPPLLYTVVVYREPESGRQWNPGTVEPYRSPDPYFVRRNVPVREGFTSEIEIEFDRPD